MVIGSDSKTLCFQSVFKRIRLIQDFLFFSFVVEMKLFPIILLGFLAFHCNGFEIAGSSNVEAVNKETSSPLATLSLLLSQNSPYHAFLNALANMSQNPPIQLCKTWILEYIKMKNVVDKARLELEEQQFRKAQDLKVC